MSKIEKNPIPLEHNTMGPISEVTNQLVLMAERWKRSHAYRYRAFSRTEPHYEDCAYAIKTRHLYWNIECQEWAHELTQLRDHLTQVLDALHAQKLVKQQDLPHD